MSRAERLRAYARLARAEGMRSTLTRAAERCGEWRRRAAWRLLGVDEWRRLARGVRVLNLLPTPPIERLGGVQIQFLRRFEVEARQRPCAWLHPEREGWRLAAPAARAALNLAVDPSPGGGREARFAQALRRALELTGAQVLHLENLAGVPLASLARLADEGLPLIVSLHDFAVFCPRPLLIERPAERFCGYARDAERCGACLAADGSGGRRAIEEQRALGARLLGAARALVFPSEFLRRRLGGLMPVPEEITQRVIAPSSGAMRVPGPARRSSRWHVAFAGAVRVEKGALVFAQVVERLRGHGLRFTAYGGGEPEVLLRLRALGVRVCGYYRAGTLPSRLAAEGVDAVVLPSIGPESYGLTLDECVAAGVPAVVFDAGAPAERVRAWGAGRVVPLEAGAQGIAEALVALRAAAAAPPSKAAVPTVESAARAHVELYAGLS